MRPLKTISIRELHEKTGQWVRLAEAHERIVITDRSEPIAALVPYEPAARANRFVGRKLLPAYRKLRGGLSAGTDSSDLLSRDRDRAEAE